LFHQKIEFRFSNFFRYYFNLVNTSLLIQIQTQQNPPLIESNQIRSKQVQNFVFFEVLWDFYIVWILKSELYKMHEKLIGCEKKHSFSFAFLVFMVIWALDLGHYFMGFTFPTLLPSRGPCKKSKNTLGLDFVFRNRLLVFLENTTQTYTIWIFCVFLWC